MIICLCNHLNEKAIRCAIEDGACSASETFQRLGCSPMCGRCVPEIDDTLQERAAPASHG